MINKELKVIFIHIPKNAGTSIEQCLGGDLKKIHKGKVHASPRDKHYRKLWKDESYFKFCFTRNPFDRLVSAYEYDNLMSKRKGYPMRPKGPDTARRNKVASLAKLGAEGFNIFVKNFFYKRKGAAPYWYRRQSYWTEGEEYDFIGRVENIQNDFQFVSDKLQIENKLKKINVSKRKEYKAYYNEESIEIVSKFYKKDLEKFNYSF